MLRAISLRESWMREIRTSGLTRERAPNGPSLLYTILIQMNSPSLVSNQDNTPDPPEGSVPRLSVRGIAKSFDTNQVLSGIELEVYEGEVVALLGENGAGKSTLSSIIAGLIQPSAGAMSWEGR